MPEVLSRSQRRIVAGVMSIVEPDGFVIAGAMALLVTGVGARATRSLAVCSSICADVAVVADRLAEQLRASGYLVDVHRADATLARMTVSTGTYRRTVMVVELSRRPHHFASTTTSTLGPTLSISDLAAETMRAAANRREPRDIVDLVSLAAVTSLHQAVVDACAHDPGFGRQPFVEMVERTLAVRDDLWPQGADPDAVRDVARGLLLEPELFASHPSV